MTTPQANPILLHLRRLAARLEDLPDRELLHRYVNGHDEEAFARLMRRHQPLVQGVALRVLGNWHDSEDVAQAAFLVLARKADSLRWHDSVACWLYRVAHHLALKAKAATDRRRAKERRAAVPSEADAFDDIRLSEARALLDAELEALPTRYRAPILLCCLEAATQEEAARQLGCSPATLKRRLAKGRELLRIRLARRGLTLSAALMPALLSPEPGSAAAMTLSNPSAAALTLAEGALRAMTATKLRIAAAMVLVVSMVTAGTGWVMQQAGSQPQAASSVAAADQPITAKIHEARKDFYGDDLPPGALARLGTVRFREGGWIQDFDLSPDGGKLLTTGWNNSGVHMWDVATGKEMYRFPVEKRPKAGYTAAFSPDGQMFATGGFFGFSLWQTSTGKRLYSVEEGSVNVLTFSPDGKILATGKWAERPTLWETATGKKIAQLEERGAGSVVYYGKGINSLAFAPNGRVLASTYGDFVLLWDVAKRKEIRRFQGHDKPVHATAFSPDGKGLVSAGEDKTIRLWDAATGRELRQFKGHEGTVTSLAFSADGKTLISGSGVERRAIRLWDVASGEGRGTIDGHTDVTCSLILSKDGKRLLATDGGVVRWWDLATRREVRRQGGHRHGIAGIAFAPDGKRLATASGDGTVRLWDAADGREVRRFDASSAVSSVAFSPDGRWIAGGDYEGAIHTWDVSSGREICRVHEDKDKMGVHYITFSSDGATLGSTSSIMRGTLWDVATGKERLRFKSDEDFLNAPRHLVRASDVAAAKKLHAMVQGRMNFMVSGAAVSADGTVVATTGGACYEKTLLMDATTGRTLGFIREPQGGASVAFSPDGRAIASGGCDGIVRLWEIATLKKRAQFAGHRGTIGALAFSPDSRILASGGTDTTALLWDVHSLSRRSRPFDGEKCWQALVDDDAAKAYQAISDLVAHPEQAVPLLRQWLPVARAPEAQLMARLLADLDSDRFEVRDKAMQQIEKIGECAKPSLQKALDGKPSLEVRLRIKLILSHIEQAQSSQQQLRILRAVEALEHIGTPEARRLLETLASGAAAARLTREAQASLARLGR